ncbi:hypothetical protein SCFA_770003 [anaerobic digester metagenome]|uniref:Uncharacterized protein n=1 Tax=anaerobic digester metagenome TaxID=1263854 RepID=A0A485MB08_9ZZZZ
MFLFIREHVWTLLQHCLSLKGRPLAAGPFHRQEKGPQANLLDTSSKGCLRDGVIPLKDISRLLCALYAKWLRKYSVEYCMRSVVPGTGLEPARACAHQNLNLARLPIPPSRHADT